ncbi:Acetyltransferase [Leucobacter sp. 7(1)]|uniref:GNAT family N-acetyltransferase n=1 Tax=Leucobacter sp. 7(1) TaxID=1255613 RepID=UPI00097F427E|nr:GNAT family N-acetyltransferase [Leucobacter sp. 7(1)]SJN09852.1 Acetyltransferase [Leucobacter sp. 7(1)]
MLIRPYAYADATPTLKVFFRAIELTARAHYSKAQRAAWADRAGRTIPTWHVARSAADTWVAEVEGRVVGFADLDASGTIDMLFVDPDFARRGIAAALLARPLSTARARGLTRVRTNASDTACPFFLAHGFRIEEQRTVVVRGVSMSHTALVLDLEPEAEAEAEAEADAE